ncbi:nitrile hydratase accessory protein [Geodermatophilus sp. URMC 64]
MTVALDIDGPAAPPRSNGELVFAEPWEGRAFGLTMALVDAGAIDYETFRTALIDRIAAADPDGFSYYRCWLQALEQVLAGAGLVSPQDVGARSAAFAARPAGHDHRHEHGHDHD